MWIAVLGSVKLFPFLAAALKGVFNRVLNFFPNASTTQSAVCEASEVLANSLSISTCGPLPSVRTHALRSSCLNELNDNDTRGVLRAAAKPGLATEL